MYEDPLQRACCQYTDVMFTAREPMGGSTGWATTKRQKTVSRRRKGTPHECCDCAGIRSETTEFFGGSRTRSLDAAYWGKCCSCTVRVVYFTGMGWASTWHQYLEVTCPGSQGNYWVEIYPLGYVTLSGEVLVHDGDIPSDTVGGRTVKKTCHVDCLSASAQKAKWQAIGPDGWYIPPIGSYFWPNAAFEDLCSNAYQGE